MPPKVPDGVITSKWRSGDGDKGRDGTSDIEEDEEGSNMEIDQNEQQQREAFLAQGHTSKRKMDPPRGPMKQALEMAKSNFGSFWEDGGAKLPQKLRKKLREKLKHSPYTPPFAEMEQLKRDAVKLVKEGPNDLKNWHEAYQKASHFTQKIIQSGLEGFNISPPDGWLEKATGQKPPKSDAEAVPLSGDTDEDSNGSSDSESSADSDEVGKSDDEFDADASDTIEALAEASGAQLPLSSEGDKILAYSARGNVWEVLVKQGGDDNVRYRMMPANGAKGFSKRNPVQQNLAEGQRGLELNPDRSMVWKSTDVKAIKGVAWKESGDSENPLDDMFPGREQEDRFPVTRVYIEWTNNKKTWETRTTVRKLYSKNITDKLIYQRAGIAEQRWRRDKGLDPIRVQKMQVGDEAPTTSTVGGSVRWAPLSTGERSYRSRSTRAASTRTSVTRASRPSNDTLRELEINARFETIEQQFIQFSKDTASIIRKELQATLRSERKKSAKKG
ncbi:MAG: hypothetical protein LQ340_002748 [Diploschistes diacapsis]|nr:MAG: hypothetical protein LQ340_002748 [Diploschistes diacapsis]